MVNEKKYYPNLTWAQFAMCNDDATGAFEDMVRRLFSLEFLKNTKIPHSDHNNPGVEVLPILEPVHSDGSKQRTISFQAKYFENNISYSKIKDSMIQAINHYGDSLDLIYLFCNKTLTTTSNGYKNIEKLLREYNIELYPISNKEVLDLVAKYNNIANYFFLPRRRPDDIEFSKIYEGIVVSTENNTNYTSCPIVGNEQVVDSRLIESLVQEKIYVCKTFILEIKFDKLREELDKIFKYDLTGVPGSEILFFYKLIADLHADGKCEINTDYLTEQYKSELLWLKEYYNNPEPISVYAYASHCAEIQVMIIEKMFVSKFWKEIVSLYNEVIKDISVDIVDTVRQYYGMALFNLQRYAIATDLFKELYQKNHKEDIRLYSIFAEMKYLNVVWRDGIYEHHDRMIVLLEQLELFKGNQQYENNKNLVAILYLETSYNLGINQKQFLENVIDKYQHFSEDVKCIFEVKYLYALCLELNGSLEIAESIYADLDWKGDVNVACRYFICKLAKSEYAEVINLYGNINPSVINSKLNSLYLAALFHENRDKYEEMLKECLKNVQNNFESIIDIAFGVCEKSDLQKYIIPLLKNYQYKAVESLSFARKLDLILVLSNARDINFLVTVIKSIEKIDTLNSFIINKIYDAIFAICNREYISHNEVFINYSEIEAAEKIADIFLEANISCREFLQIKCLCAGTKGQRLSMLKYTKELFAITKEEYLARNIIAMLLERNETDFNAYVTYISALRGSKEPDYCIAVALAMLRLGRNEEADLYAYKALYYLNDNEDYEVYKNYFFYYSQDINRYHNRDIIKRVKGNTVVILKENLPENGHENKIITVCLDSESEFSDSNNKSMDIIHIPSGTPLYLKIMGSNINQVIKIDNINYRIIDICSRNEYAIRFIFKKINLYPERFNNAVQILSFKKPEELIEKIRLITNRKEHIETLLNFYNFKENTTGAPIDLFTDGDYDRYVDVLTMLLLKKDQAFYAGLSLYEDVRDKKYVLTLSTLVLLSSMNVLDVLDKIKNNLLIPTSYISFFADRYRNAKETNLISAGKLANVDDKLTFIKNDSFDIEVWERIIDFCEKCEKIEILDEERIGFSVGKEINGEQFISLMRLHLIHLDAFILAEKQNATLLCDDLFFRKLASCAKIRNINIGSLLRYYCSEDNVFQIIKNLSETNYLYIPFVARTDEEAAEVTKNILDGELKKKYYGSIILAFYASLNNIEHEKFRKDYDMNNTKMNYEK